MKYRSCFFGVLFIVLQVIHYSYGEISLVEGTMPHTTSITCTKIVLSNIYPNAPSLNGNEVVLYNDIQQTRTIDFLTGYWATSNNKIKLTYGMNVDDLKVQTGYSANIGVDGDCFTSGLASTIYFDLLYRADSPPGSGNYIVNSITLAGSINLESFNVTGVGGAVKKYFLDPVTLTTLSSDVFTFDTKLSINPSCSGSTCTNPCPNCNQLSISFVAVSCATGYSNCNGKLTDGCETNTQTDPNNCGLCGTICTAFFPHVVPACVNSACTSVCVTGWRDCNLIVTDGCEISIINDVNNCGGCGASYSCVRPNMFSTCNNYQCIFDGCRKGYYDCDEKNSNGCESTLNDMQNCGKCGNACGSNSYCSLTGNCVCNAGYGDCDSNPENGCEASILTDTNCGGCGRACGVNQFCNGQQCTCSTNYFANCDSNNTNGCEVDIRTNNDNCGSCGNNCGVFSYCDNKQCLCSAGYADCTTDRGCETDLRTIPNCGGCGVVCSLPNAISECSTGICKVQSCIGIFENCDGIDANGCETSVTTATRCGSCTNACGANSVCGSGGICTCVSPFENCNGIWADGCEINLNSDSNHCASCFDSCGLGSECVGGICEPFSCPPGQATCTGHDPCDINILTDPFNCGRCDVLCGIGAQCDNGICTCLAGLDRCIDPDNCSTNITENVNHCGECGNVCSFPHSNSICSDGICSIDNCETDYANCDLNSENGCETLITTIYNCGACFPCGENQICAVDPDFGNYICQCSSGLTNCSGVCVDLRTNNNCFSCGNICPNNSYCNITIGDCVCDSDYHNCDGDFAGNGCETSILTPSNCGGCGIVCSNLIENATSSCLAKECVLDLCYVGLGDCDNDILNGCESPLDSFDNCGACNSKCKDNQHCSSGVCVCDPDWKDCNNIALDGCETSITTTTNCGDCDFVCDLPNATSSCPNRVCEIQSCDDYYKDCNGNPLDGCETSSVTNTDCGACGNKCNLNENCDGSACRCIPPFIKCVASTLGCPTNLDTDIFNCGGCGTQCSANMDCIGGYCYCQEGYENCDENDGNGCETDLSTTDTCGTCGLQCYLPNATPICNITNEPPTCDLLVCNSGFGNCDEDPSNGCEVQLNSLTDCGSCGTPCDFPNAVSNCVGLVCDLESCDAGFGNCNQVFTDGCETPLAILNNCGTCGGICDLPNANSDCSTGTCQLVSCYDGFGDCDGNMTNGCEVPLDTEDNCAYCGNSCHAPNSTPNCNNRVCELDCDTNYLDCDSLVSTGCEVDLRDNINHCGTCENNCDNLDHVAHSMCTGGVCVINNCKPFYDNCNQIIDDGCETPINTITDCGFCNNPCVLPNALSQCDFGVCEIQTCFGGYDNCDGDHSNGCEIELNSVSNCGNCGATCVLTNAQSTCSTGSCQISTCNYGWLDCDSTGGCETQFDVNNCGGCGIECNQTNTYASCTFGICGIPSCVSGFADCDGNVENGCETSLYTLDDCGYCNTKCILPNAISSCPLGNCVISDCNTNYADCDASPGCETHLYDNNSCGTCGNICPNNSHCDMGTCACDINYENCDLNMMSNGCEAYLLSSNNNCGTCGSICDFNSNLICYNGTCVIDYCLDDGYFDCDTQPENNCEINLQIDNLNCGTCGNQCPINTECVNGICKCLPNYGNCDNDLLTGCEVSFLNDDNHCGTCENDCISIMAFVNIAAANCSSGFCEIISCDNTFLDCNGDYADGCEVNLQFDDNNCGSCNNICDLNEDCFRGNCNCANTFFDCDNDSTNGCEVIGISDNNNCGGCGNICGNNSACVNGICSCLPNFSQCLDTLNNTVLNTTKLRSTQEENSCLIDLLNDNNNCGGCGISCKVNNNMNTECINGICTPISCVANHSDCNNELTDGCEVNILFNPNNCGTCGTVCNSQHCNMGTCFECDQLGQYADCNDDGLSCETNLWNNNSNCGACGNVCPQNTACSIGNCLCSVPFADCDNNLSNGCEMNLFTNSSHCGQCSNKCSLLNANSICNSGVCAIDSCLINSANCDNIEENGCEINLLFDAVHCGGCDRNCNFQSTFCSSGVCRCKENYLNCDEDIFTNGCESFIGDINSCGACGNVCETPLNGSPICFQGSCEIDSCNDHFADCDFAVGNGCETNLLSSGENCGECGLVCLFANSIPVCSNGVCEIKDCQSNFENCDGELFNGCEIYIENDIHHCGNCNSNCNLLIENATPICFRGNCDILSCDENFENCDGIISNGCEVNILNSNNHCGDCGNICHESSICIEGSCVCVDQSLDCDSNTQNGCETDGKNDMNNCGGCGVRCPQSQSFFSICSNGKCIENQCSNGLGNCDLQGGNGCETNLLISSYNCGACGKTCSLLPNVNYATCTNGNCEIILCAVGYQNNDDDSSNGCEFNVGSIAPPDGYSVTPPPPPTQNNPDQNNNPDYYPPTRPPLDDNKSVFNLYFSFYYLLFYR